MLASDESLWHNIGLASKLSEKGCYKGAKQGLGF